MSRLKKPSQWFVFLIAALLSLSLLTCKDEKKADDDDTVARPDDDDKSTRSKKAPKSPLAHEHLPPDCQLVGQTDFRKLLAVPAVKEHLLPTLRKLMAQQGSNERIGAFFEKLGVDPTKDLGANAWCAVDLKGQASSIITGNFKPNTVVAAIRHALTKPAKDNKITSQEDLKVAGFDAISIDDNIIFQDKKGNVYLGGSPDVLEKMVKTSDAYKTVFNLPLEPALAVVALPALARPLAKEDKDFAKHLDKMKRGVMTIELDPGRIVARVTMTDKLSAFAFLEYLEPLLEEEQAKKVTGSDAEAICKRSFKKGRLTRDASDLVFTMTMSQEDIGKVVREVAESLAKDLD